MLHARVGQGLHAEISLVCARLEEVGHLDECEREGMCGAAVASAPGLLMLNAVTRSCADVPSPACVTQLEGLASDHSTMKSHSMSCFRRRLAITRVGCPLAAAASACCTGGAALSARCLVVEHSAPISYRNASELFERPGTQRKIDRHERLRRAPSKRKSQERLPGERLASLAGVRAFNLPSASSVLPFYVLHLFTAERSQSAQQPGRARAVRRPN